MQFARRWLGDRQTEATQVNPVDPAMQGQHQPLIFKADDCAVQFVEHAWWKCLRSM